MQAARRKDTTRPRPERSPDRADQAHPMPRHYVVFRATTRPDGTMTRHYEVPGPSGALDEHGFDDWLRERVPQGEEIDLVSVLVIQEELDGHAAIRDCCLERRRGSPTGPLHGAPARVNFTGAVERVRLYRTEARGALREMTPKLDRPPPRLDHLAGEQQAVHRAFGPAARVLDMRAPTVLEDIIGLSSIVHLVYPGWHRDRLRAGLARHHAVRPARQLPALRRPPGPARRRRRCRRPRRHRRRPHHLRNPPRPPRTRRHGPLAPRRRAPPDPPRRRRRRALHARNPPGLFNADQALWARYAEAHENLTLIDAHRDGRSDDVFVIAGAPDGSVTRHLIDADGTEVWRAAADHTAAAAFHRDRVTGPA